MPLPIPSWCPPYPHSNVQEWGEFRMWDKVLGLLGPGPFSRPLDQCLNFLKNLCHWEVRFKLWPLGHPKECSWHPGADTHTLHSCWQQRVRGVLGWVPSWAGDKDTGEEECEIPFQKHPSELQRETWSSSRQEEQLQ